MSKISFNKLCSKKLNEVNIITFNDIEIEVKKYLGIELKQSIIDMSLETSANLDYVNRVVSDAIFNYLVVLNYTDIELTTKKEKENPIWVYDLMEESGLIDAVMGAIPEQELGSLVECYEQTVLSINSYKSSLKGSFEQIIKSLPQNVESINNALENFDPEKFKILNDISSMVK